MLLVNPAARGSPSIEKLRLAVAWLETKGWEAKLSLTEHQGHAIDLATEAVASGYDVVVACGGDGTINEVANGLAMSDTALAVIRGGTANVWAKEISIPRDPLEAVRLLVDGQRRRIDLGLAEAAGNRRFFLLMAGVGLDGYIVSRIPEDLKQHLGATAYILHGVREGFRFRCLDTTLVIDGESMTVPLYWLLAANTRSYGGVINVAHRAVADDGLLDVYVFQGHGIRQAMLHGLRVLSRRHDHAPNVIHRQARHIELSGLPDLEAQVDGDSLDFVPRTVSVVPGALTVVVPSTLESALFAGEPEVASHSKVT
ncbi:MAG: diacylglycerol kinase family protein [Dehalococcoidia bacterium]